MKFNFFDKAVKKYYSLNKDKSRYLILFNDGTSRFYAYNKDKNILFLDELKFNGEVWK